MFRTLGTREDSAISASGTPGTREDLIISASGTLGTREDSVDSGSGTLGTQYLEMTRTRESVSPDDSDPDSVDL